MESIREVLDYEVDVTLDTTYFGKYISPHQKALINKPNLVWHESKILFYRLLIHFKRNDKSHTFLDRNTIATFVF
jgi:hypothetical protein